VNRPLSSVERSIQRRQNWLKEEAAKARESRGEAGLMEFWLRLARSRITKDVKAGRGDVHAAFALICRLFITALDQRAQGDQRIWTDLLQYAEQVVAKHPPRH
jgi:predicted metal-dependent hydrolase